MLCYSMFTGIKWVKDRDDAERRPCFKVKWGVMYGDEPAEIKYDWREVDLEA